MKAHRSSVLLLLACLAILFQARAIIIDGPAPDNVYTTCALKDAPALIVANSKKVILPAIKRTTYTSTTLRALVRKLGPGWTPPGKPTTGIIWFFDDRVNLVLPKVPESVDVVIHLETERN